MKNELKVAFTRCLTDLMKADKIISTDEILYLEQTFHEFSISQLDIENALSTSLAEACSILAEKGRRKERQNIVDRLKLLSLSDSACAREEALLILAISYCLSDETRKISKVVSFKSAQIDFVDSQVLFVEPNEDEAVNTYVRENFKTIMNEMRIGGFDFVYIPNIAKHYRETNQELLCKIIKYLAPTLSDNETHNVLDVISHMTTKFFKNEILGEKLGMKLSIKKPSLLIKIGNSYVRGELTSDFLLLELQENISQQINVFIDIFLQYQHCPTITIKNFNEEGTEFVYTGFYKTIFDLITYRKGTRCTLIINPDKRKGRLEIINDSHSFIEIGLAETAFYVFLIIESLSLRRGVNFVNIGQKRRKEIQDKYSLIYSSFVGCRKDVPDITESNTRNRMLSIIRKAVSENNVLTEKQLFTPNTDSEKIFIPIETQLIFVKEGNKSVPLLDTSVWHID